MAVSFDTSATNTSRSSFTFSTDSTPILRVSKHKCVVRTCRLFSSAHFCPPSPSEFLDTSDQCCSHFLLMTNLPATLEGWRSEGRKRDNSQTEFSLSSFCIYIHRNDWGRCYTKHERTHCIDAAGTSQIPADLQRSIIRQKTIGSSFQQMLNYPVCLQTWEILLHTLKV